MSGGPYREPGERDVYPEEAETQPSEREIAEPPPVLTWTDLLFRASLEWWV